MELKRPAPFLATDSLDTPDDGLRYEVIDGELFVSAAPIPPPVRGYAAGALP